MNELIYNSKIFLDNCNSINSIEKFLQDYDPEYGTSYPASATSISANNNIIINYRKSKEKVNGNNKNNNKIQFHTKNIIIIECLKLLIQCLIRINNRIELLRAITVSKRIVSHLSMIVTINHPNIIKIHINIIEIINLTINIIPKNGTINVKQSNKLLLQELIKDKTIIYNNLVKSITITYGLNHSKMKYVETLL